MDAVTWVAGRAPDRPESLAESMRDVIRAGDPGEGPLPERLASAALHALGRIVREPSSRSHALELLAADALLTYACEAALEEAPGQGDGDPVQRLVRAFDLHRFAAVLPQEATE